MTAEEERGIAAVRYHNRHACGHAVYWEDPGMAVQTEKEPCPWCRFRRTEGRDPGEGSIIDFGPDVGYVYQTANATHSASAAEAGLPILIQHWADDRCCRPCGEA